jgi:hypothetical protein
MKEKRNQLTFLRIYLRAIQYKQQEDEENFEIHGCVRFSAPLHFDIENLRTLGAGRATVTSSDVIYTWMFSQKRSKYHTVSLM